jgi:mannose-6-phosphate isomerase-like protein (cupin superfamily)
MTEAHGAWRIFQLDDLLAGRDPGGRPLYQEFLQVPSLSLAIYRLPAGSKDMQGVHDEDEVYFVVAGKARIRIGDEERVVGPGNILYVQASSEHSFFEVEEDMTLLVLFAPERRKLR